LTHEDLLEKDIKEGKYPELAEQRDDLHHLYRRQKMRDLTNAQLAKVKSLSQMHTQKRGQATDGVNTLKKSFLSTRFTAASHHHQSEQTIHSRNVKKDF